MSKKKKTTPAIVKSQRVLCTMDMGTKTMKDATHKSRSTQKDNDRRMMQRLKSGDLNYAEDYE